MDYNMPPDSEEMSQFQHHRGQPQRQQTITARDAPLQNQYQFVPGQYHPHPQPPPSSLDHHHHHHQYMSTSGRQLAPAGTAGRPGTDYSTSAVRTHQQNPPSASLQGAIDYNPVPQQSMSSDLYYYPSEIVGGGDQSQSFSFTGGGGSQQYHDPSFTPASDLHTLPAHTSVSPPWTEEHLPQGYGAGPSSAPAPRVAAKRDRGPAKKTAGRKRPRKSGAGGDSESESDEDTFEAAPTPSRGPENMPPRL